MQIGTTTLNLHAAEAALVREALCQAGDMTGAATLLGISRARLVRLMRRHRTAWPALAFLPKGEQ